MKEVVRINLDNEMDLILAHKRSMKIAELCGLSLSSQTSFATAVSEIARCSINYGKESRLVLGITFNRAGKKEITAVIQDSVDLKSLFPEPFLYVERLLGKLQIDVHNGMYTITLFQNITMPGLVSESKISAFIDYFKYEPPLSPYDEIRKKNIQLIELSEKLGESENKYRQLTDTLPLLVFSINNKNEVSLTNKWLNDYLGKPFTSFSKASLQDILHPDDVTKIATEWQSSKNKQVKLTGQARIKSNGGYIWHLISVVPQKTEQGDVNGWIGSFVDIHAQKTIEEALKDNKELRRVQEQLETQNKELSKKNRELEQFAYVASHDLQEPLRKIRNFTSLAQRNLTAEETDKLFLNKIDLSAERMSNLIRDILSYSKLSIDENKPVAIDLTTTMRDIISDFDYTITSKNATVVYNNLPRVKGIPVQINQLFYNLISNSLKFTRNVPHIDVSSRLISIDKSAAATLYVNAGNYNLITFTDNGIGIDAKYSEKVFTIFQRLHAGNEFEGTGIGLALCKKIMNNHNGAITFTSEIGKGTSFNIYLPA